MLVSSCGLEVNHSSFVTVSYKPAKTSSGGVSNVDWTLSWPLELCQWEFQLLLAGATKQNRSVWEGAYRTFIILVLIFFDFIHWMFFHSFFKCAIAVKTIYLTSHHTIQSVVIMLPSNLKSALNSTVIQFCNILLLS